MKTVETTLIGAALLGALALPVVAVAEDLACAEANAALLFVDCAGMASASLVMVAAGEPVGADALTAPAGGAALAVTGAYTSGERHEPEGMFIRAGEVLDPYPQGWDGLAVIDGQGRLTLHHVERVTLEDETWNLRERPERRAFVETAKDNAWSVFQSHMLVIDRGVDTKPRDDAPAFRRRILMSLESGAIGIYDSGAEALTLHDVAERVAERFAPVMALNLDMGSYDFCQSERDGVVRQCGALNRAQTGKLTNILLFSAPGTEHAAGTAE